LEGSSVAKRGAGKKSREGLSQDGIHRESEIRESLRSKLLAAPGRAAFLIAMRCRLPVDFHPFCRKVHQPDLENAGAGIQEKLGFAISVCRRVGHLDEEEDIRRTGVGMRIEIRVRLEQGQVRLGLRVLTELNRVLGRNDRTISHDPIQQANKPLDTRSMAAPDRGHLDDLPIKKLHSISFREHPGLPHTMELLHREQPSG
jgi:hypothetical protein